MRRELAVVAACVAVLTLATGCVTSGGSQTQTDPEWHEQRIDQAFQKALEAEDPHEQALWRAEYERRVRAYEAQVAEQSAARTARYETWRQLGAAVQEVGVLLLTRE